MTASVRTSRSSPGSPSRSRCACSTTGAGRPVTCCPKRPPTCATATCPASDPGSATGSVCTGHGPRPGLRCNPASSSSTRTARRSKARSSGTAGLLLWPPARRRLRISGADSAASMPKNVVISPYFDWGNDRHPQTPWHETVVYEMHVKGFTAKHPDVPAEIAARTPGSPPSRSSSTCSSLGVTAVELQPVHQFIHDANSSNEGLAQLLGLQLDLLPRAPQRVLGHRAARPAGAGVQAAGEDACTRPGSR